MTDAPQTVSLIREQNDRFRKYGEGHGSIMLTRGVQALGEALILRTILAVRDYDDFNEVNDPWHEHDFGAVDICGNTVFFKIDYYDLSVSAASPDPSDPERTYRALTIMLAEEY